MKLGQNKELTLNVSIRNPWCHKRHAKTFPEAEFILEVADSCAHNKKDKKNHVDQTHDLPIQETF